MATATVSAKCVYLITGSSRGIGLELVKQLAEADNRVIATCRNPDKSVNLKALQSKHPDLVTIVSLDVSDEKSIADAASLVMRDFESIDVLINNAGGYFSLPDVDGMRQRENTLNTTYDIMKRSFDVNTIGPVLVTQAFYPLLQKASSGAKLANISSVMGSMGKFGSLSVVSYTASKAALNMVGVCQASDFKKNNDSIIVLTIHPGWVDTDMGRGAGKPPLKAPESVRGILKVIAAATEDDSGSFKSYEGEIIPW